MASNGPPSSMSCPLSASVTFKLALGPQTLIKGLCKVAGLKTNSSRPGPRHLQSVSIISLLFALVAITPECLSMSSQSELSFSIRSCFLLHLWALPRPWLRVEQTAWTKARHSHSLTLYADAWVDLLSRHTVTSRFFLTPNLHQACKHFTRRCSKTRPLESIWACAHQTQSGCISAPSQKQ